MASSIEPLELFWNRYAASELSEALSKTPYETTQFGDSPEMADLLGQLVVAGKKTATCAALWEYEAENEPLPAAGSRVIVVDGQGQPMCIIETTEVELRTFERVDPQFAWEEGENDRTLESWRREHWSFFSRTLPHINRVPTNDMPLVCERFRVVYVE